MDPNDEQNNVPANDTQNPSPDDDLEETRTDPLNSEVGDDPLAEDNDRPADAPTSLPQDETDSTPTTDDSHPSNDTGVDPAEKYDQGV